MNRQQALRGTFRLVSFFGQAPGASSLVTPRRSGAELGRVIRIHRLSCTVGALRS